MIREITHGALKLDTWLQEKLGRPYNVLLSIGLVSELVQRLSELPKKITTMPHLVGDVVAALIEVALLIHQVGALSHRIDRRRARSGGEEATTH
jgi:hypothetical protein